MKLKQQGLYTAYDLSIKDPRWARKSMTVTGERLVRELQGFSCISLNSVEPDRQSIQVTRSFGVRLTKLSDIEEAISAHATRLGEKLRKQNLVTPMISVFCRTSPFSNAPYYKGIGTIGFDEPTSDTTILIKAAMQALSQAFKAGLTYQKAGIHAYNLAPKTVPKQKVLFQTAPLIRKDEKSKLYESIDAINRRFGKDTAFWASSGINPRHVMKQNQRSPRYTTRWGELKWVSLL